MSELHLHLDTVGGIAGDMFCAAMLDAFPALTELVQNDLAAAGVLEHVNVTQSRAMANGIAANYLLVEPAHETRRPTGHYQDIRQRLLDSSLPAPVTEVAIGIFDLLAQAEAQVHNVPIERVHFHEVADWDSIADIVSAASLIHHCAVQSWSCSSLPIGGGLVKTEHGQLPVPAPATTLLLRGFVLHDDGQSGERVTPTGAAILRYLVAEPSSGRPAGVLLTHGVGCGTRRFKTIPNIVRALVSQEHAAPALDDEHHADEVAVLAFEVDDMSPEELATALDRLRDVQGVLDVSYQVRFGKKGRPQFAVQILAQPHCADQIANESLIETSTLGVRFATQRRQVLARQMSQVVVGNESFPVKLASRPDGAISGKVEADSLRRVVGLTQRRKISAAASSGGEPRDD